MERRTRQTAVARADPTGYVALANCSSVITMDVTDGIIKVLVPASVSYLLSFAGLFRSGHTQDLFMVIGNRLWEAGMSMAITSGAYRDMRL